MRCEHQSNSTPETFQCGVSLIFAKHELPCAVFIEEIISPIDEIYLRRDENEKRGSVFAAVHPHHLYSAGSEQKDVFIRALAGGC